MQNVNKVKVMVQDFTANDKYDGDILRIMDGMHYELFSCASGDNYITPTVIFDTMLEAISFINEINNDLKTIYNQTLGENDTLMIDGMLVIELDCVMGVV